MEKLERLLIANRGEIAVGAGDDDERSLAGC